MRAVVEMKQYMFLFYFIAAMIYLSSVPALLNEVYQNKNI